jgi:alpha-1,2-mannosyltransferase
MTLDTQARSLRWLALAGAAVAIAAWATSHPDTAPSDFEVFWSAGARFMAGDPLYPAVPIDVAFLYPPFAAWLFQFLAQLPLDTASRAFAIVNSVLYFAVMWLSGVALSTAYPESRWRLGLAVGVTFTFPYAQWNTLWGQSNLLVLVLVLGAIVSIQRDRLMLAGVALAIAAGIKVIPAIFGVWLVLRFGRRAVLGLVLGTVLVVSVPLLWRGPSQGMADLAAFVDSVLRGFLTGGVRVRADNYNLATLVYGVLGSLPANGTWQAPYFVVDAGETIRAIVYRILTLTALGGWVTVLLLRRKRNEPWSLVEVTATFLLAAMVSGVTWNHHLVTLLFVMAVLVVELGRQASGRWLLVLSTALLVTGSVGRDVVGSFLYGQMQHFHVMRIGLVMAFVWTLISLGQSPDTEATKPEPRDPGLVME